MLKKTLVYSGALLPNLMVLVAFAFLYINVGEDTFILFTYAWTALSLFTAVGYIVLIIDIWKNKNLTKNVKVLWTAVALFISVPGLLIYFLVVLLKTPSWNTTPTKGMTV